MTNPSGLGTLQQLALLAVARLGREAFGNAIRGEIRRQTGRDMAVSTIYVTLVRLEEQGLASSELADAEPGAGGRGKRFFRVTPAGWTALRTARAELDGMWEGVEPA